MSKLDRRKIAAEAAAAVARAFPGTTTKAMGQDLAPADRWVSTGSIALDRVLSRSYPGGLPIGPKRGRVLHLFGDPSTGKTVILDHMMLSCQRQGGYGLYAQTEEKDEHFPRSLGIDLDDGTVRMQWPDTIELMIDMLLEYVAAIRKRDAESPILIGIDSVAGDTRVMTPEGEIAIRELVGKRGFWVYCVDDATGKLALRSVKAVAQTGRGKRVLRVRFGWKSARSGSKLVRFDELVVTRNHEFKLYDGTYRKAKDLRPGDRLLPVTRKVWRGSGWYLKSRTCGFLPEPRFVAEQAMGRVLVPGETVHHADGDHLNNAPSNLDVLPSQTAHIKKHWREKSPEERARLSKVLSETTKVARAKQGEHRRAEIAACGGQAAWRELRADPKKLAEWRKKRAAGERRSWSAFVSDPEKMAARSQKIRENNARMWAKRRADPEAMRKHSEALSLGQLRHLAMRNHRVVSVEDAGTCDTYDLCVADSACPNFVANGIVVHNSLEMVEAGRTFGVKMSGKESGKFDYGGGRAIAISQGFRKMAGICSKSPTSLVILNQVKDAIGVMFGAKKKPGGGNSPKFFASAEVSLTFSKYGKVESGVGNIIAKRWVHARAVKNKIAAPFATADFLIDFEKGVHPLAGLLEQLAEEGRVVIGKGQTEFTDKRTGEVLPVAGLGAWVKGGALK